jgi:pilus assembly protein CpaF
MDDLSEIFNETDKGSQRLMAIIREPSVSQVCANRHDRIFYTDATGTKQVEKLFTPATYRSWINQLMTLTDAGYSDVATAQTSVIEGSFDPDKVDLHGSIHVVTKESSGGDPIVTVRKQPKQIVQLDQMLQQRMMSPAMLLFLEHAVRGRLNIVVSGGSGAGKTTLLRALAWNIPPDNRCVSVEDIRELHLEDRLPNVAPLSTHRVRDEQGRIVRETTLVSLVEEALRMRPDRIIVGECRGKEAHALVKSCTSGHDGSWTTVHADTSQAAWKQLVGYVTEAGVPHEVARDRIANAFHLSVQISRGPMGQRLITEITELEPVTEGSEQRRNPLFAYDWERGVHVPVQLPTPNIIRQMQRYGVNYNAMISAIQEAETGYHDYAS